MLLRPQQWIGHLQHISLVLQIFDVISLVVFFSNHDIIGCWPSNSNRCSSHKGLRKFQRIPSRLSPYSTGLITTQNWLTRIDSWKPSRTLLGTQRNLHTTLTPASSPRGAKAHTTSNLNYYEHTENPGGKPKGAITTVSSVNTRF